VIVELTNRAASHKVPTGSALRQLRLQVEVEGYDGRRYTKQRTYGRVTVDARGKPSISSMRSSSEAFATFPTRGCRPAKSARNSSVLSYLRVCKRR